MLSMGCLENHFLYFPYKYPQGRWEEVTKLNFPVDDCSFTSSDNIKLHGWFAPFPNSQTCILWLHGNAGNVSHRLEHLRLMRQMLKVNIFIIDYRGYGRSQGKPSETGLYEDALAAYRYLSGRAEISQEKIYIYGQSLGAAVAVFLAEKEKAAGLILEAPFSSLMDAAADIYPWLPVRLFTKERYASINRIGALKIPILIIHGLEDDIIAAEHSRRLYRAAPEPKELLLIKRAGHNDLYYLGGQKYWDKLKEFIK